MANGRSPVPVDIPASAYGDDPNWPPAPRVDSTTLTADTDHNIRCGGCGKLLIEFATRPYSVRCARCKAVRTALPHSPSVSPVRPSTP